MSGKKTSKKDKLKLDQSNGEITMSENNDGVLNEKKAGRKGKKKAAVSLNEDDIENNVMANHVGVKEGMSSKKKKKRAANNNVVDSDNKSVTMNNKKKSKPILEELKISNKKSKKAVLDNSDIMSVRGSFGQSENEVSFEDGDKHMKEELFDIEENELSEVKPDITDKKKEEIMWSNEDLMVLVANMEKLIPEQDNLAFATRSEKLEWDKVIFKHYSIDECKKTWALLSKKIRKFRLLHEVLNDARELILNPPNQKKKNKQQVHPDMPKRPLSSYLLFYLQQKDNIVAENPGIELTEVTKKIGHIYKNLPPETKSIYDKMAADAKEAYEEKMKQFYINHPEYKLTKPVPPQKPIKERAPKKPLTPFGFFYQSELERNNIPDNEKQQYKDACKDKWKQLTDKKKLVWISWAEEKQIEYEKDLQHFQATHPDYVINHGTKLTLTKEEKSIKERVAGKPVKPPNSAYALFARTVLQSEDVKKIPTKERLNFVSAQWKIASEEEKQQYRQLQANLMDQYKIDFAHYLDTLPEDQRKIEMQNNTSKRRRPEESSSRASPKKKKRKTEESTSKKETEEKKPRFQEPEQPPLSAFKYFAKTYSGKESVQQAWKKLSQDEKEKWERELTKKKHEYIAAFEQFLKSLSKEELAAFSDARNQAKQQTNDVSDEDEDGNDDSEDSDADSSESGSTTDDSSDDE